MDGVAHLPELLDEGVALVVLLQREEDLALLFREQDVNLLPPRPVLLGEPGDRRALLGGHGPVVGMIGRGRQGEEKEEQEEEPGTPPVSHG